MADDITLVIGVNNAPVERAVRLLDNLESEVRAVQRAEKAGLITRQRAKAETDRLSESLRKLRTVSQGSAKEFSAFEKGLYNSGKAARQNEVALQQAGYQFQDFIVQVQAGTNPLIAFSQQGSQLAGFFAGPWGAAIGLGIAAVGALGTALMGTMEQVESFEDQLGETTDALDSYFDVLEKRSSVFSSVFEQSREALELTSQASKDLIAISKIEAFDGIKKLNNSLSKSVLSASFFKTEIQDVANLINASFGETVAASMGGAAGKQVRAMYSGIYNLQSASDLNSQYAAALKLREIFKENVDINGDMTDQQKKFFKNLSESILKMELLGATTDATKASWSETVEATEAANKAMELFYENAEKQKEASDEVSAARKEIRDTINAETRELENSIRISQLSIKYGKDSAEVAKAKAEVDRENYKLEMQSLGIKGKLLTALMNTYDQNVKVNVELDASEEKARAFADALKEAVSAMSSLATFSSGLDKALAVSVAKVQALKSGADAAVAGLIAGKRVDLQNKMDAAAASGVDRSIIERMYGGARQTISQLEASEAERVRLQGLKKGGGSGSQSEDFSSYMASLEKELELKNRLVGMTEEQKVSAQRYFDIEQKALDIITRKEGKVRDLTPAEEERIQKLVEEEAALRRVTEAEQKRKNMMDTIEGHIENAFMAMIDGSSSVEDAFKGMLRNILLEVYRQQVAKPAAEGIMGVFSKLFSANGNVFMNGAHVKAFANGGVVNGTTAFPMRGGVGIMGEAGPEAIMPLKRGANGKLGVEMHGGGQPVNIVQNFNFSANGDDSVKRIIAQEAPKIANLTQKQIMDQRRRGGAMKSTFG